MKDKKYTLKDAVKLFFDNEDIIAVEAVRNERDLSNEIEEIDMGKGDKFFIKFTDFMFLVNKLDAYEVIFFVKNGKPYGFSFSPNKREFYSFRFKI